MPALLPELQPAAYTPKPAQPFKDPPSKTPAPFKQAQGTKPGQVTSPFRINKLSPPPPAAAAKAGRFLARVPRAGLAAVALELLFPPTAGDNYYDRNPKNPPAKYKLRPPEPAIEVEKANYPFRGGQGNGVFYDVVIAVIEQSKPPYVTFETIRGQQGPIIGLRKQTTAGFGFCFLVFANGARETYVHNYTGNPPFDYQIQSIVRSDRLPDTSGDPLPINPGISSSPGNYLGSPSAAPPSTAPAPAPKAPSPFGSPSGTPKSSPSGTPGSSPNGALESSPNGAPSSLPRGFPSPRPAPNPGTEPQLQKQRQPEQQPSPYPFADPPAPKPGLNLGTAPGTSPARTPASAVPSPSNFNSGNKAPAPAPGTSPNIKKNPAPITDRSSFPDTGFQPLQFEPRPLLANPLTPRGFAPNPKTGEPEPKKAPPLTEPLKTPNPTLTPVEDLGKQIKDLLLPIGGLLAGITGLVQPEKLRAAANAGTCEAFSPTGCAAPVANNAAAAATNSANNSVALSALSAAISALQSLFLKPILTFVTLINTKLGPLMSGADGISGFLGRVSKSMGIDRALNLIAIAANLHNAMMLSANLKITLLEMLSSVGNATGLLQTPDGENVDLNQVFNAGIEAVLIKILGVDSYAGLKVGLRKYNAIYQAAANSLNAVSSMFNSLGNVVEQGAEYTGRIGNALKGAGRVAENSYRWRSEKFDVKSNKFIQFQSKIGDVTQILETINEIAETVVEGQQAATEFQQANKEFIKAVEDAKRSSTTPENKEIQSEAAKAKENATKDPTGEIDTGLLSFLTN